MAAELADAQADRNKIRPCNFKIYKGLVVTGGGGSKNNDCTFNFLFCIDCQHATIHSLND